MSLREFVDKLVEANFITEKDREPMLFILEYLKMGKKAVIGKERKKFYENLKKGNCITEDGRLKASKDFDPNDDTSVGFQLLIWLACAEGLIAMEDKG